MINDYNDRRINTDNNIDNIIDYIDTLNSQGSKLIKSNNLMNNENKLSNFDISNNKIDNYNDNYYAQKNRLHPLIQKLNIHYNL